MSVTALSSKMAVKRVVNFNPGPSTLPLEVLQRAQQEFLDFRGTGMSVVEISHRSKEYEELNNQAMDLMRELMGLDKKYHVLFLGGGASTQFTMIPLNFLHSGKTAAYVNTGSWSDKAIKEAKLLGTVHVVGSSKEHGYAYIPRVETLSCPADASYLHITSNNTIFGTQWHWWPESSHVPLVCDMSSDICSRRVDFSRFSLIYAGAQKNIGPAGVTVVIIRDDLLAGCRDGTPTMFDYRTHVKNQSLYNTPPVFAVYLTKLVLEWIKSKGGLSGIEEVNRRKQQVIYDVIDDNPDYYRGTVQKDSRSWMNVTIRMNSEEVESKFLKEATAAGFVGLKGHRDVGGIRVSLYNALPLEGAQKLAEFMEGFKTKN